MSDTEIEPYQYLSYSGWTTYEQCPYLYKLRYIDKNRIDAHEDMSGGFLGSAIGKVFEWFYDRKYWMYEDVEKRTLETVRDAIVWTLDNARERDGFVLEQATEEQKARIRSLKAEMLEYIPKGIANIRKYKLLSDSTRTEFKLDVVFQHKTWDFPIRFGGRADFVHGLRDPHIIDGKAGSKDNVDNYQLIWYATQHYLKFHVAPTRLAFIFWRSPDDFISWVDYDDHHIRRCVSQTYETAKKIRLEMFDPKPSKKCSYCPYRGICKTGQDYLATMVNDKPRVVDGLFQMHDL